MKADNSRDYSRESLSHDAIFLTFLSPNPRQPYELNRPPRYIGVLVGQWQMLGHIDLQQNFADLEAGNTWAANKIF